MIWVLRTLAPAASIPFDSATPIGETSHFLVFSNRKFSNSKSTHDKRPSSTTSPKKGRLWLIAAHQSFPHSLSQFSIFELAKAKSWGLTLGDNKWRPLFVGTQQNVESAYFNTTTCVLHKEDQPQGLVIVNTLSDAAVGTSCPFSQPSRPALFVIDSDPLPFSPPFLFIFFFVHITQQCLKTIRQLRIIFHCMRSNCILDIDNAIMWFLSRGIGQWWTMARIKPCIGWFTWHRYGGLPVQNNRIQ